MISLSFLLICAYLCACIDARQHGRALMLTGPAGCVKGSCTKFILYGSRLCCHFRNNGSEALCKMPLKIQWLIRSWVCDVTTVCVSQTCRLPAWMFKGLPNAVNLWVISIWRRQNWHEKMAWEADLAAHHLANTCRAHSCIIARPCHFNWFTHQHTLMEAIVTAIRKAMTVRMLMWKTAVLL